ncbi:hypothetical protein BCR35DRAFT_305209 [Leucosporidium creatinivorum]|uniref:Uncharacterized protein n=1 Tax=Leucosporidium creatinivorum TaxID=106004 RepID=A0A1Y2F2Y3_9BASI|nr:hypothetical protein BCR35DRAFT_305209 [Leucosporidium creatinivorum]
MSWKRYRSNRESSRGYREGRRTIAGAEGRPRWCSRRPHDVGDEVQSDIRSLVVVRSLRGRLRWRALVRSHGEGRDCRGAREGLHDNLGVGGSRC